MRRKNEDAGAERHLHLLFCEKGGGKIDTRKRITIRLPQDVYRDILDNLGNAASSTFNSFITNAARFYLGYIKARETEDYLSKTLLSINRISTVLYKPSLLTAAMWKRELS